MTDRSRVKKTDEEYLEIKHLLESKGFTYSLSDEEYIAEVHRRNAPFKVKIARYLDKFLLWAKLHPKAIFWVTLSLIAFGVIAKCGVDLMVLGSQVLAGKISAQDILPFDYLAGFVFTTGGVVVLLGGSVIVKHLLSATDEIVIDEEKEMIRKAKKQIIKEYKKGLIKK